MTYIPGRQRGRISDQDWAGIRAIVEANLAAEEARKKGPERDHAVAYGYRRVSHEDSAESGLSMDAQTEIIERYFAFLQSEHPGLQWGGWLSDPAVSAYRGKEYRLFQRPAGRRIPELLQRGDHLISAKLDRTFRNVRDCLSSTEIFKQRGILFHACDWRIDTDTANGILMLTFMAAIAEWQSRYISERTRAALSQLRKTNRPAGKAPMGLKIVGEKHAKRFVVDERARSIMGEIVRVRDSRGWSWWKISDEIEAHSAELEKRPPRRRWERREWSMRRCRSGYRAELALRAQAMAVRETAPDALPVSSTPEAAGQPTP